MQSLFYVTQHLNGDPECLVAWRQRQHIPPKDRYLSTKEHRVTFQKIMIYVHCNLGFNANDTINKNKYINRKSLRLYGISCGCLRFICFWRSQFRLVLCGQYGHCRRGSLPHSSCTCLYKVLFHRYNFPQEIQLCPTDNRYRFAMCKKFWVWCTDSAHILFSAG
jgi:hypothetical protein